MGKSIEEHWKQPKYKQPYNIKYNTENPALDAHLSQKEHRRQKYERKHYKSKSSKRRR